MKGTILKCLQEMVESQHGKPVWQEILDEAGLQGSRFFTLSSDVADADAVALFQATASVLELGFQDAANAFGDHWVNVYAPRVYQTIYGRLKSAREFILAMDGVHVMVTNTIENAHPPRFEYEEQADGTLLVTYKSQRGLIDIYIGLVYGVGKFFDTPLQVTKLSARQVRIRFP